MILCDGSCERGYHFDCIGLAAVPDGDWFCHECKQVLMARTFLRQRSLLEPSRWLSTAALPFGIGDFVVVLYPTYSHAEMYFGLVHEIGIPSSSFEDRLAIKLQWWPLAEGRSWPHFAAAPDPSSGRSSRRFGRFCGRWHDPFKTLPQCRTAAPPPSSTRWRYAIRSMHGRRSSWCVRRVGSELAFSR
jgi:hypothetical protein